MVINYLLMAVIGAAANDGEALPPSATSVPLSTLVGAENARKDWHDDFEEAVQEAARLGLPMVAHFHAKWCGPCQQMEEKVLHTTEVTKVLGLRVVGVKIDVDHNPDLITRFNVEALPTDIYIASDGLEIRRLQCGETAVGVPLAEHLSVPWRLQAFPNPITTSTTIERPS